MQARSLNLRQLLAGGEHPIALCRLADGKNEKFKTVKEALTGGDWNPLHWHWREALTVIQIAGRLPAHPASNTYFSMAPIRYGKYVAKYRAKPAGELFGEGGLAHAGWAAKNDKQAGMSGGFSHLMI